MTRTQIAAARAHRAGATGQPRPIGPVSTDLRARTLTPVSGLNERRSRRGTRLTATQRNSQGRRSEWSMSPYAPYGGWR